MRKQTKLVAVLSAAALLAIGASMTSMAATRGWVQEDDTWVYLNGSGERVTEEWKKSGSYYYWLDENGEIAKNQIIEDDDNYYYVNEDGVRLTNQWVSIENEDDETVDGKDVSVLWYYLGTSGRAYKSSDPDMLKNSVINGKRYFFDENGHMVSGWTTTTDNGGAESTYFLGDENEGWAYTGWQWLELSDDIEGEYDVDEAWFNFKSSGKARKSERTYISNAYYAFDDNGVMLDDWQDGSAGSTGSLASPSDIKLASDGKTFYNIEVGNQGTGWVHTYQYEDEGGDEKWFYLESSNNNQVFNSNGKDAFDYKNTDGTSIAYAQKYVDGNETDGSPKARVAAKVIKGKTYLFDDTGVMLTGVYHFSRDVKRDGGKKLEAGIYYFSKNGGSAEGRMETGRTTIDYDGEKYTYYFNKGGNACVAQLNDGAVYDYNGVRVEAKDGNSNQAYEIVDVRGNRWSLKLGNNKYVKGTIVVSSTGKIRTGTITIDDVKYTVSDYVVVDAYDKNDSTKETLTERFTRPERATGTGDNILQGYVDGKWQTVATWNDTNKEWDYTK